MPIILNYFYRMLFS